MMKEIGTFINLKKEVPHNNSSHLKEGVKPIVACVGTPSQFRKTNPYLYNQVFNGIAQNVNHV